MNWIDAHPRSLPGVGDAAAPDYDNLSDWEAEDAAGDELMATPEVVAEWLLDHCDGHTVPAVVRFTTDVEGLDVPALLATVMTGSKDQAFAAIVALRDAFRLDKRKDIQTRAVEIYDEVNAGSF